jgi:hypothetical protein
VGLSSDPSSSHRITESIIDLSWEQHRSKCFIASLLTCGTWRVKLTRRLGRDENQPLNYEKKSHPRSSNLEARGELEQCPCYLHQGGA